MEHIKYKNVFLKDNEYIDNFKAHLIVHFQEIFDIKSQNAEYYNVIKQTRPHTNSHLHSQGRRNRGVDPPLPPRFWQIS